MPFNGTLKFTLATNKQKQRKFSGVIMTKVNLGRTILALVALFFLSTGLMLMLNPESMLTHMFIGTVESNAGLSSVRAIWGSSVIAIWGTVFIAAIKANKDMAIIGLVSLILVLVGRISGVFFDGLFPELTANIIPTIIAIVLVLTALRLMKGVEKI